MRDMTKAEIAAKLGKPLLTVLPGGGVAAVKKKKKKAKPVPLWWSVTLVYLAWKVLRKSD